MFNLGGFVLKDITKAKKANIKEHSNNKINFTVEQLLAMLDNIPVCINVLNESAESIYCNAYTVDLYNLNSKDEFLETFYNLTPEKQPNGKNSKLAFSEYVLSAIEQGEVHFNWLDKRLNGEELPLHISIYKLNIKDENGADLLVSTMQDLSSQLAGFDEVSLLDELNHNHITYKALFNSVAELTEEWFWIYDVKMATIQFFGKGREILGLTSEKMPFPSYVVDSGMVYPDDLQVFLQFEENLRTGVVAPCEVRFIQPNGTTKYYRIIFKTMYNKEGLPIFSIGKTYDIDKQKKLEVLSKTDLLTNCLNKITTENIIKETLISHPNSSHALYLIDVDDFKSVNDDLGHYFGDITLSDIAKNLHSNFRNVDVIGRIGGDEFLVFVKDISNEVVIERKAKSISDAFKNSYSGENKDYKISGSIGIALFPKHASSYEELYKCADKALYSSKLSGKDRYTIYSDEIANSSTKQLTTVDNSNKQVNAHFDSEITAVIFDLIYQSKNTEKSMNTIMRLLGTHLNVDRCYICQTFDNGKRYCLTFEWALESKFAKKDRFQNIPAEQLQSFFTELESKGIMYNNPITELNKNSQETNDEYQPDYSYLLTQTKGKGSSRLILGIEDNNQHRIWSEKEITTIQYILKLISIFLSSAKISTT